VRSVTLTRQGFPFALALLAGALLYHTPGHGVTLGNVASQSGLGQPLRVVIPLTLASGEALHVSCLKLVADNTSGAPQIVTGRVNLEQAATKPRLVITTPTAVYEPAVRLSVQAGCGSTSRRDYVLLLDPPALESPTMVASADDDPPWIVAARERANAERAEHTNARPSLQRVAAMNPDQSPSPRLPAWGTPVDAGSATPSVSPSKAVETKAPSPVVASAPAAQSAPRAFVNMVGSSSAFIPEASAAPIPPRLATTSPLRQTTTPQSIPLMPRPQPQASPMTTLWQQNWQYVVAVGGMLALGLGAFAMRRRLALMFIRTNAVPLRAETQAATFAHFEAMTEPVSIQARVPSTHPEINVDQTVAVAEFDTLLHDIRSDMIDEKAVKDAWKEAATDAAVDIGTDSILKAIAAAERDLEIGSPPKPRQTVMDRALDDLTVPNEPKKLR